MKKISRTSFIAAIVLIVLSIALSVLGFICIDGIKVVHHSNYNGYMRMAYYTTSDSNIGLGMVISGGFLFVGGIILLSLSALLGRKPPMPPKGGCCKDGTSEPAPEPCCEPEGPAAEGCDADGNDRPEYVTPPMEN